jgi:hypothetical protein
MSDIGGAARGKGGRQDPSVAGDRNYRAAHLAKEAQRTSRGKTPADLQADEHHRNAQLPRATRFAIYDGREFAGFVLTGRARLHFYAFDAEERPLGAFPARQTAIEAVTTGTVRPSRG